MFLTDIFWAWDGKFGPAAIHVELVKLHVDTAYEI
jgi:hypothetical protein